MVRYLAARYGLQPAEIATIGDMPNDVLMLAYSESCPSRWANADPQVKRAARHA